MSTCYECGRNECGCAVVFAEPMERVIRSLHDELKQVRAERDAVKAGAEILRILGRELLTDAAYADRWPLIEKAVNALDSLARTKAAATAEHGWTRHGHRCCDQAIGPRPNRVARCGGPGLCGECSADMVIRHSPASGTLARPKGEGDHGPA